MLNDAPKLQLEQCYKKYLALVLGGYEFDKASEIVFTDFKESKYYGGETLEAFMVFVLDHMDTVGARSSE